jgi:glycosyltransferase involved in cell wall biosynthesis
MKIAYLLTQSLESPSGLGRYWPIAQQMAKFGHEVNIFALHPDIDSIKETKFHQDGVHIHYVAPMHVLKKGNEKIYYPASKLLYLSAIATWKLSRAILQSQTDIVHIGKPHPMNSLAGMAAKIFKNLPIFLDCDDYEAESNRFSGRWQQWVVKFIENRMPRQAKMITTNTHFTRDRLVSLGVPVERIFYLPNGVDRNRFLSPDQDQIEALRTRLECGEDKVIVFVGTLSLASHPVDLLLDGFTLILKRNPNCLLLLVGGGEDFTKLQALAVELGIAEKTRFCGRISPDDVRLYYRIADVSVDPVHDDHAARGRSPLKMFESWANGVPFVTGDVGDRRMIAGDPSAALLASPGSAESLASNILEIINNPALADRLIEQGFQRVEFYYWDQLSPQLEELYRQQVSLQSRLPDEQ